AGESAVVPSARVDGGAVQRAQRVGGSVARVESTRVERHAGGGPVQRDGFDRPADQVGVGAARGRSGGPADSPDRTDAGGTTGVAEGAAEIPGSGRAGDGGDRRAHGADRVGGAETPAGGGRRMAAAGGRVSVAQRF